MIGSVTSIGETNTGSICSPDSFSVRGDRQCYFYAKDEAAGSNPAMISQGHVAQRVEREKHTGNYSRT